MRACYGPRPAHRASSEATASIANTPGEDNLSPHSSNHPSLGPMNDSDAERLSRLRHDLSNPLSALLAEAQLLLLNESNMDAETLTALREIEALAIRMRTMLREL
jgi:signal transduction histidine kinase